jgi:hypothetical protein
LNVEEHPDDANFPSHPSEVQVSDHDFDVALIHVAVFPHDRLVNLVVEQHPTRELVSGEPAIWALHFAASFPPGLAL